MVSFSKLKELYPENWSFISKSYKERKGYRCEECGKQFPPNTKWLHVHHIVPLSKGGSSDDSNLKLLCYACHAKHHSHMGNSKNRSKVKFSKPFD